MDNQDVDFYQNFRNRMKDWLKTKEGSSYKWADYLMVAPDLLHLLCKLSFDKDVPVKERAKLATALAYFISPIDLVPEVLIGVIGYTDDIVLAAYVLNLKLFGFPIVIFTLPLFQSTRYILGTQNIFCMVGFLLYRSDRWLSIQIMNKGLPKSAQSI